MKSKSGAIEIQFNWIFVLIIGAIILVVFSGIIVRQKNVSETSKNVMLLNSLDAILSGSESAAGTVNIVRIPESRIEFSCHSYSIGKSSKQIEVMNVFPPSILEGDRLIASTLDFSVPYRISNIVYLTDPGHTYLFLGDGEIESRMKELMPSEADLKEVGSIGDAAYGQGRVRIVFFGDHPELPASFAKAPDADITALRVDGTLSHGTLEFYRKSGNAFESTGTTYYLGEETLLGAVFSDDLSIYECTMGSIFEKIGIVTGIYKSRTIAIRDAYSSQGNRCAAFGDTTYSLDNIEEISSASGFNELNIARISEAASRLRAQNRQAQLQSCATIY